MVSPERRARSPELRSLREQALSGELPRPNAPSPPSHSGLVLPGSSRGRRAPSRRALERPGQCTRRPSQHWWWPRIELTSSYGRAATLGERSGTAVSGRGSRFMAPSWLVRWCPLRAGQLNVKLFRSDPNGFCRKDYTSSGCLRRAL